MGFFSKLKAFFKAKRELERMRKEDPELDEGLKNFYSNYKVLREHLKEVEQTLERMREKDHNSKS